MPTRLTSHHCRADNTRDVRQSAEEGGRRREGSGRSFFGADDVRTGPDLMRDVLVRVIEGRVDAS